MNHHSHFGVYGVITNNKNELLLIKKARGPYTGLLDLPGGSLEEGETMEQAFVREIKEETGCDVTSYHQIGAFDTLYRYQKDGEPFLFHHVGVLYQCEINGTPMQEGDGEDSHGCVWQPAENLHENNATPFVLKAAHI